MLLGQTRQINGKRRLKTLKKRMICRRLLLGLCLAALCAGTAGAEADGTQVHESAVDVPILMYHSILQSENGNCYCLSAAAFRSDLQYLKEHGYQTVFVSQLSDYVLQGRPLPEKPVVITLDDGHLNALTAVLPILEELDMKATVSVVGCYTEKSIAENDPNPNYAYLTWQDIEALQNSGRVEIGNHTFQLHELSDRRGAEKKCNESTACYQALLREDLTRLQTWLTQQCGTTPRVFAYPYGFASPESLDVLKELGFTAALTCKEKINHLTADDPEQLYDLGRYNRPSGVSTGEFMRRVGLF